MKTELLHNTKEDITRAGRMIAEGGLVGIPTETVYGLGANALNPEAVKKIFAAKGRPQDNPLIVHISSLEQIQPLVASVPEEAKKLMRAYWPGPLTIILPKTDLVPPETSGGLETVAIRMPEHPVARAVIDAAGVPVAAPSANLSGLPSPTTAQRVVEDMDGKIEAVLDGGPCRVGVESTVVTLATPVPRLLRPGAITLEQLKKVLGQVDVDEAVFARLKDGEKVASPGMKYKHYAPKADVIILKGGFSAYRRYIETYLEKDVYCLCFAGEEETLPVPAIAYGAENDDGSQAHSLFDVLRQLDDLGAKKVYARCPSQSGVGMAVYNRLIRAAAYQVIDLDSRLVLGLTGPTGAGKSFVASILVQKGFYLIDTDQIARRLTEPGSPILPKLEMAFGQGILLDGVLDRKELARRAFHNPEQQAVLNAIIHPTVIARAKDEMEKQAKKGYTKFVLDVPLLFESGMEALCYKTIAVLAERPIRKKRILERDALTEAQAEQRLQIQKPDSFYEARADYVLYNNHNDAAGLETSIKKIIKK